MAGRKRIATIWIALSAFALPAFRHGAISAAASDERQEIRRLAELMKWKPETIVADIGAGDGKYSFAAREHIGPAGRVYATEIDEEKLKGLRKEVASRKLANVIVVEGSAGDTKLPTDCCDAIFLRHVYHHISEPEEFDRNLVRSLRAGAHLAIIDFPPWEASSVPEGVPKNRGGHGIPQKLVVDELTAAGLHVEKVVARWSGDDYCILFVKPTH